MAEVVIQEVYPGIIRSFQSLFKTQEEREATSEPLGICTFARTITIPAIGAGDVMLLSNRFDFPENFAYIGPTVLNMTILDGTTSAETWLDTSLEVFFRRNEGAPIQLTKWPISRAGVRVDPGGSATRDVIYSAFNGWRSTGGLEGYVKGSGPEFVQYGLQSNTSPVISLRNNTSSTGGWTMHVLLQYLVYTVEQANRSGLYWQQPVLSLP